MRLQGSRARVNSFAPGLKLRRNQVALASHAVAGIERHSSAAPPTEPGPRGPSWNRQTAIPGQSPPAIEAARRPSAELAASSIRVTVLGGNAMRLAAPWYSRLAVEHDRFGLDSAVLVDIGPVHGEALVGHVVPVLGAGDVLEQRRGGCRVDGLPSWGSREASILFHGSICTMRQPWRMTAVSAISKNHSTAGRGRCHDLRRRDGRDRRLDGYAGTAAGHRSPRGSLGVEMKPSPCRRSISCDIKLGRHGAANSRRRISKSVG